MKFFFRALTDKALAEKGTECKEERITAMFFVKMNRESKKTLVIGKCRRPPGFKSIDIRALPVAWE